jgi:uncharacterized membrane protein
MTMGWRKIDSVAIGGLALGALATIAVYDKLPDPMATHFDLSGHPNGWMPRAVGAWFGPVFGLGIWAFVRWLPKILPSKEKARLGEPVTAIVAALTAIFLLGVHVLLLRYALDPGASLMRAMWIMMGALYVALGLIMPRVKRNALIGIRTPWTFASDENWARTQRVGGYAMVVGGVLVALLGLIGGTAASVAALVVLLASAIIPVVYSLVLARRRDEA